MRYARLALLLIGLLAPAALAQAAGRVVMRDGFFYKPHEISISGDGDFLAQGLHWRSWGGKTAVADGQAVEQERPSHVNHTYPVQVTVSRLTYCGNIHRTVYNEVVAQILGPNPGVFGGRTLGRVYTCAGTWQLVSPPASAPSTTPRPTPPTAHNCSAHGVLPWVVAISEDGSTCGRARTLVRAWFHRLKLPGGNACSWVDGSTRPGVCSVGAWRCSAYHTVNGQTYPVVCTKDAGHRRVRFVSQV